MLFCRPANAGGGVSASGTGQAVGNRGFGLRMDNRLVFSTSPVGPCVPAALPRPDADGHPKS